MRVVRGLSGSSFGGSGFRVFGLRLRVQGLGFSGSRLRVQGLEFGASGLGFRV